MTHRITVLSYGSPRFTETAALFDEYRVHYGQPSNQEATARWLSARLGEGTLNLIAALHDDHPVGLVTTVRLPASLRLGTICSIRDLYVAPSHRRNGTARALLDHVITKARSSGDLRVSLQTEPDNTSAQALYAALGFHQVHGLDLLNLTLVP
ncbi:GNAT family N-acetyltransferase [Actinoplanes derwentensis]|uniref:Acetyltransferase (GNAT) family protein n=1 Tax=Actinoplanes derwentensis TaxID=113562 RepID=A0A1H2CJK1_9ACTN|nr:GNAT family N-acetyltransferase [Actinoplanes derwentensis]GID82589.1 N-acetyltransferase [Actinoplanes derwentensis]SDT70509.1 Acetyltransferase (GNAT) family protein [Actinoplanes derwentensis]